MARGIIQWICLSCGKPFEKINTGHKYKFCSQSCATQFNKPSQKLLIPDGQPMSKRTQFRRKRKAGLTQPVFRYPFNEQIFDSWSHELAWLLGLIWSDGCLFGNSVEICSKDFDLMELVEGLIEMPNGIRPKNKGQAWRIVFTSQRVVSQLKELGLTEAKSHTINFPLIPDEYIATFVRGLLDGDGSVVERFDRPGQQVADISVQWVGASPFMRDGLLRWLNRQGIVAHAGISHSTVWRITIHRQESLHHLYSLLYPNESVTCLRRKRVPYQAWIETPRVRVGRPKMSIDPPL